MPTLTITEALAEVKTLQKRIAKKRELIGQHAARQNQFRDPLEKDGGSKAYLAAEAQAVRDLEQNVIALRAGIQRANHETLISVGGQTRSIADWLTWRRELAPAEQQHNASLRAHLDNLRRQCAAKNVNVTAGDPVRHDDLIVNLDEGAFARRVEEMETILGTLDGQLSLKNATTMVSY